MTDAFAKDFRRPDAYSHHLAAMPEESRVTASEDIFNEFGVLLVPKGAPLSPSAVARLEAHRLARRIEDSVSLRKTLTEGALLRELRGYLESRSDYQDIHEKNDFELPLVDLFNRQPLPRVLLQKLTVMQERLPESYRHQLFSAWACGLIAQVMGLDMERRHQAFLAGLCHDLGLLHIDPALLDFSTGVSDEKVRALHSHVLVGERLVVEMENCSAEVARAVREHHERLDRSGYPVRPPAERLGLLGQIIAGADLLHHLSLQGFGGGEAELASLLPHFKVHTQAFEPDVCRAVFLTLSRARHQAVADVAAMEETRERISRIRPKVVSLAEELPGLLEAGAHCGQGSAAAGLESVAGAIRAAIQRAGFDSPEINQMLEKPADSEEGLGAEGLEEADAVLYEILWLFRRLGWCLDRLLETAETNSETELLAAFRRRKEELLSKPWELYSPSPPSD